MSIADTQIRAALERYLDLDEQDGLDEACALAAQAPIDIAALLDWVQRYRCAPQNRARALTALRAALRLPVIPGPPCRS